MCNVYIYIYIYISSATYGTIAYANLPLRQPIRNASPKCKFSRISFRPLISKQAVRKKGGFLPFLDCSVDAVVPQEISKEIRGAPWLNGRLSFVERRGGTSLT